MGADGSSTARVQRGLSQAARCASTEDHQAPSPLLFCEQEEHLVAPFPFSQRAYSESKGINASALPFALLQQMIRNQGGEFVRLHDSFTGEE